ncbi:hypothetical protein Poly30_01360 [Planctomycetes bacterium Poly30]|uniref:Uncharacterized protein n=1 Tax=Saltatorellus ferox TaxID=2528018 RepID=A0A518EKL9_9BACT|nr:hypothetical protein Poly30_01360 [Planctomycetes bacterium Poly30]
MNYVRSFISLLIALLVIISVYGVLWWENPPAPIANYEFGARVILGALVTSGLVGLWQLWSAPTPAGYGE